MMKIPLVFILHDVRSMNNVGALFRTADALGLERLFLCGLTGCPPHREIQKTALGATETVPWDWVQRTEEAIIKLRSEEFSIIALEQTPDAISLENFHPSGKTALIVGNEIEGIPHSISTLCDQTLVIQQFGAKKSINVAVAGGIAGWWLSVKLRGT
jgi:tRNA G18 (ribose-2'-O)-methylase SpoU